MVFLTMTTCLGTCKSAWDEANLQVGGGSSRAHLDFSITIPTILYLQVGFTGATTDRITFTLKNLPGNDLVAAPSDNWLD